MIEILSLILSLIFVTLSMLGYGLIINKMVQEHIFLVLILNSRAINMSADIRMVLVMVKERIYGQMVKN